MAGILIIDDDYQVLRALRLILEADGHEVHDAPDGKTALRRFAGSPTELVITDILMPEQDGVETVIELKREFADARIIAISGGGRIDSKEYLKMAERLGVPHTFSKPFNRGELLQAIQELLGEV